VRPEPSRSATIQIEANNTHLQKELIMADYITVTDSDGNTYQVPDEVWMGVDGPEEVIQDHEPGFMDSLRQTIRSWMEQYTDHPEYGLRGIIAENIIQVMCEYEHGRHAARYAPKIAEWVEQNLPHSLPNLRHQPRRPDQS
jgi:hypothetical protein